MSDHSDPSLLLSTAPPIPFTNSYLASTLCQVLLDARATEGNIRHGSWHQGTDSYWIRQREMREISMECSESAKGQLVI